MVKRTLIIITLALGLAALITLFQVGKFATGDQPQSQATVNEQMNSRSAPASESTKERIPERTTAENQSVVNRPEAIAAPEQLDQERLVLDSYKQRLDQLKVQQARQIEQMNRDQIDLGIMQTEQNLQQLQNLIAGPISATAVTVTEQQTRITNLQNLFQEQTEQLNLLKEQRANLSALSFQQNNQTRSIASEQTAEVADAQVTTQDQIFNLRDELLRLESANQQARMSLMPISQQINRAEQDYQNQLQKLQALQNTNPPANTTNQ